MKVTKLVKWSILEKDNLHVFYTEEEFVMFDGNDPNADKHKAYFIRTQYDAFFKLVAKIYANTTNRWLKMDSVDVFYKDHVGDKIAINSELSVYCFLKNVADILESPVDIVVEATVEDSPVSNFDSSALNDICTGCGGEKVCLGCDKVNLTPAGMEDLKFWKAETEANGKATKYEVPEKPHVSAVKPTKFVEVPEKGNGSQFLEQKHSWKNPAAGEIKMNSFDNNNNQFEFQAKNPPVRKVTLDNSDDFVPDISSTLADDLERTLTFDDDEESPTPPPVKAPVMKDQSTKVPRMKFVPMRSPPMEDLSLKDPPMKEQPVKAPLMKDQPVKALPMKDAPMKDQPIKDPPKQAPPKQTPLVKDQPMKTQPMKFPRIKDPKLSEHRCPHPDYFDLDRPSPDEEVSYGAVNWKREPSSQGYAIKILNDFIYKSAKGQKDEPEGPDSSLDTSTASKMRKRLINPPRPLRLN